MNIFKQDYDGKVEDNAKMLVESALSFEEVYEPVLTEKMGKTCLNCNTLMESDSESGDECPNCKLVWDKLAKSDNQLELEEE